MMISSRVTRSRQSTKRSSVFAYSDEENEEPPQKPRITAPKPALPDRIKNLPVHSTPRLSEDETPRVQSPLSPIYDHVANIRQRLENMLTNQMSGGKRVSPVSPDVRAKPVSRSMQAKQQLLSAKHQQAKSRSDGVSGVGGGISLWPGMKSMRLTSAEFVTLIITCLVLFVSTVFIFNFIHGESYRDLEKHRHELTEKSQQVTSLLDGDPGSFTERLIEWHKEFLLTMSEIEERFNTSLSEACIFYHVCVLLYVCGITSLLYLLYDNIFSKSNLTPYRIKVWVCLLVVLGTWTLLSTRLLLAAQRLENSVENVVHALSELLAELVHRADLATYHNVLLYWRTRCLPPTSQGALSLLGVVAVRDVAYYLQYYSLPVITALVTPVARLIASLVQIYSKSL